MEQATASAPIDSTVSEPSDNGQDDSDKVEPVLNDENGQPIKKSDKPGRRKVEANENGKYVIKVKGETKEVDLDELHKMAEMSEGAGKKWNEADKMIKQAQREAESRENALIAQIVEAAQKDPISFIKQVNPNFNDSEWAQKKILEQIELESLSPEAREAREYKQKYETLEQQRARESQEIEARQAEQYRQQARQYYENQIITELDKSELPKTPDTVRRVSNYMYLANKKGYEVPTSELIKLVREDILDEQKAIYGNLPEDKLLAMLDPALVNKLNKASVARTRSEDVFGKRSAAKVVGGGQAPKKQMNERDFDKYLDSFK